MKYIKLILLILTYAIFLSGNVISQSIKERFETILNSLPTTTTPAVMIYNPVTKDTIYQTNILRSMIPASNTKLYTTAAALRGMGPDFEFSTKIYLDDSDFSDSTITGSMYITGFGNSVLKEADLDSAVNKIFGLGVRKITGNIVGDDTFFDNLYSREDWITDERSNVSLPPVSALVVDRNRITINLDASGEIGSKLQYGVTPDLPFIQVDMSARITKFRAYPKIRSQLNSDKIEIQISGGLKKRRSKRYYSVYVPNPPQYAASLLHKKLNNRGISISSLPSVDVTPDDAVEIFSSSITLRDLIAQINKKSDNFLAECLFKALGAYFSQEQGNSFYATQAVLTFLQQENIFSDGTAVVDGSGISRFNEVSVASIAGLLENMYFNKDLFTDFYNSLAIAGSDGTLQDRFKNTIVENNFRGKTGTLNGVLAISGYLTTASHTDVIISIIMEFKEKGTKFHKEVQDKIIELTAKEF